MNELSLQELILINGGNDCDGNHEESTAYQAGVVVGEVIQAIGSILDELGSLWN